MGARKMYNGNVEVLGKEYGIETVDHGFNLELPGVETHLAANEDIYTRGTERIDLIELVLRNNECDATVKAGIAYIKRMFLGKRIRLRHAGETSTIGSDLGVSRDGECVLVNTFSDAKASVPGFFEKWYNVWVYSAAAEMAAEKGVDLNVTFNNWKEVPVLNKELNRIEVNDPNLDKTINDPKGFLKSIEELLNDSN